LRVARRMGQPTERPGVENPRFNHSRSDGGKGDVWTKRGARAARLVCHKPTRAPRFLAAESQRAWNSGAWVWLKQSRSRK
jgi:hypothetical protein